MQQPGGKNLAIRNIQNDHNGFSENWSYLKNFDGPEPKLNEIEIDNLIVESLNSPSDHAFSLDGKFLLSKVFAHPIGIFKTCEGQENTSNRFTLVFNNLKNVYDFGGFFYNGFQGILLTGYPDDNDGVKFRDKESRKFRKAKKQKSKSRSRSKERKGKYEKTGSRTEFKFKF